MPNYTFRDTQTDEVFESTMKIAERDEFLEKNPHIKQLPCAPRTVDAYNAGRMRTSEDFNSLLKGMKATHRNSTINTW